MQETSTTDAGFRLTDPVHEQLRQDLLRRYGSSQAMCGVFTRAFQERFPSLRRIAGYYFCTASGWSYGEHWWLLDNAGQVIDPTADQFPCQGHGRYEPYSPFKHKVLKGKCPCCGRGLYSREGGYPCSLPCDQELAQEYGPRLQEGPYEDDLSCSTDYELMLRYGFRYPGLPNQAEFSERLAAALAQDELVELAA